jgi:hypothetical protein
MRGLEDGRADVTPPHDIHPASPVEAMSQVGRSIGADWPPAHARVVIGRIIEPGVPAC